MKAKILNNKLIPENIYYYKAVIERFEGKEIELTIKEWKDSRTLAQNRLLWAYYSLLESETGDLAINLHEYFKRTLIPPKFIEVQGVTIKIPGSTTKLSKKEFSEYIMKMESITGIHFPFRDEL